MLNIKYFCCNSYMEKCYLAWDDSGQAALIDPGFTPDEIGALDAFLGREGLTLKAIMLTHAHFDHIYGVGDISRRFGIPVYMHPDEKPVKDGMGDMARASGMPAPDTDWETVDIREAQIIVIGNTSYEVIETPGHSQGSVCYLDREDAVLFAGDTLFAGAIGRTDLPWGDYDREIVSLMERVMWLDTDIRVLPGHGPDTTIGHERTHNPFLQPFNEKDEATGAVDGIEVRE